VDLLCCGHIHRTHVWDLSDGRHRLLCCNAGSLLDTSGKKDNGFLESEIEHDLHIVKRTLFSRRTEVLYHRPHFGDILQRRQQGRIDGLLGSDEAVAVSLRNTDSALGEGRSKEKKPKGKK